MHPRRFLLVLALVALPISLVSCADVPKSPEAQAEAQATDDPLEPMNRVTFDVNDFLDRLLIRPLTELYRFSIPDYMRARVANVVSNMKEPVIFANNLMQGETSRAGITAQRFLINTTLGVGGIFEVANGWDLYQQQGDFGQTLSVWGIQGGPYLVLPLFGPSNFRDALGLGVDTVMSPWQWIAADGGRAVKNEVVYSDFAADGLTRREETLDDYDALRSGSLDFYAEMRSVYKQYRDKQLGIQNPNALPVFEDYE
ncbi:MAG: VacJ family lipoprotein [Alphaproteobacteria bacterium]|nr:VacJ family lipoprotein [Alphaproteobacteria bacterium]